MRLKQQNTDNRLSMGEFGPDSCRLQDARKVEKHVPPEHLAVCGENNPFITHLAPFEKVSNSTRGGIR